MRLREREREIIIVIFHFCRVVKHIPSFIALLIVGSLKALDTGIRIDVSKMYTTV